MGHGPPGRVSYARCPLISLPSLSIVFRPQLLLHSFLGSRSAGGERGPWVQRGCPGGSPCAFRQASTSPSVSGSAWCPLGPVSPRQLLLPKLSFLSLGLITVGPFAFHLSLIYTCSVLFSFWGCTFFRAFLSFGGSEGHPCLNCPI